MKENHFNNKNFTIYENLSLMCIYLWAHQICGDHSRQTMHGYPVFWIEIVVYRYGIPFLFHSSVLDPR